MAWALLGVVAWRIADDGAKAMMLLHARPGAAAGGDIAPLGWL